MENPMQIMFMVLLNPEKVKGPVTEEIIENALVNAGLVDDIKDVIALQGKVSGVIPTAHMPIPADSTQETQH